MKTMVIALVAHDNRKADLMAWVERHREQLAKCKLVASGTTGRRIQAALGLDVECLLSGPLGGDQQIGARIAEQSIDMLIFFWDPLEPMPHDPDIRALLRIATLWNIPMAANEATADFLMQSACFGCYERALPDFSAHQNRFKSP